MVVFASYMLLLCLDIIILITVECNYKHLKHYEVTTYKLNGIRLSQKDVLKQPLRGEVLPGDPRLLCSLTKEIQRNDRLSAAQ